MTRVPFALALAAALAAGAALPADAASPTPVPEPAATAPGPTPAAVLSPLPAAALSPTPGPSLGPVPSPALPTATTPAPAPPVVPTASVSPTPTPYGYRFVPHQPAHPLPGTPLIFAVSLNSRTLVSKGPIWIKVETDPATVKVTSSSGGRAGMVPMVAPGDFEAKSVLPRFPFLAGGMTLDLVFTAEGPDGKRTSVHVPVALK